MTCKQIGFVDYRPNNYHANTFLGLLRGELKSRGWNVTRCWALEADEGRRWAAEKNVAYASDIEELRDCDGLMILAPSNPEVHLALARRVFPLGRPTYIDKTFAPNQRAARQIFALADKHRVPVITTSALRCAASLNKLVAELGKGNIRHLRAWGGGRSFAEYVIHPLEMVIAAMGPQVKEVLHLADGQHHHALHIRFTGNRTGSVFVHTNGACDFQAVVTTDEKTVSVNCGQDPIFRDLCSLVLDFFESGQECIDRRETLALFKVRDAAFGKNALGKFVKV